MAQEMGKKKKKKNRMKSQVKKVPKYVILMGPLGSGKSFRTHECMVFMGLNPKETSMINVDSIVEQDPKYDEMGRTEEAYFACRPRADKIKEERIVQAMKEGKHIVKEVTGCNTSFVYTRQCIEQAHTEGYEMTVIYPYMPYEKCLEIIQSRPKRHHAMPLAIYNECFSNFLSLIPDPRVQCICMSPSTPLLPYKTITSSRSRCTLLLHPSPDSSTDHSSTKGASPRDLVTRSCKEAKRALDQNYDVQVHLIYSASATTVVPSHAMDKFVAFLDHPELQCMLQKTL